MTPMWNYLTALVSNFTSIFYSHESVDYARAHFSDLSCILFFGLCVLVGILVALMGYKLARFVMFVASVVFGITVGGGCLLPFLQKHAEISSGEYRWLIWVLPAILTIITLILVYKFLKFALFLVGGTAGFFTAHWIAAVIKADTLATIVLVTIGVILFGFIVTLIRKLLLKIALGLLGGFIAAFGVSGLLVLAGLPALYAPSWPVTSFTVTGIAFAYHVCSKKRKSSLFDAE